MIKASPVLSDGAEVATTQVNNETITTIADWRDTTVIHEEREDYLNLGPPIHRVFAMLIGLAS
jgi:hypothetical protein